MANLRDLKGRISTLKNMQKVMRAMSMIATIKMRKLFRLQSSLTLFERSIEHISCDINKALKYSSTTLITGYKKVKKAHVIIFTADKGLCGSHNSSALKVLDVFVKNNTSNNVEVDITCVGNRGANYCKRKEYDIFQQVEINDRVLNAASVKQLASKILKRFLDNEIQEIHLIANYFISTLHQDTVVARLIPFDLHEKKGEEKNKLNAFIEPDPERFIVSAGELYFYYKLMSALFNSYLSEQSSRMTAMENATNNSEDLINHYVTLQNRARQATITNDLIEIISGKEALKG